MKIEKAIQQSTAFPDEWQKLAVNILYTSSWLNTHQLRFFKQFDLTAQQYNILRILRGQKGKPLSIHELTTRMIDPSSNSSRLVDKLKSKKLIDRKTCPNDRRQVEVILTEEGSELLKVIDVQMPDMFRIFNSISISEAKQLNALLDKCRTNQ